MSCVSPESNSHFLCILSGISAFRERVTIECSYKGWSIQLDDEEDNFIQIEIGSSFFKHHECLARTVVQMDMKKIIHILRSIPGLEKSNVSMHNYIGFSKMYVSKNNITQSFDFETEPTTEQKWHSSSVNFVTYATVKSSDVKTILQTIDNYAVSDTTLQLKWTRENFGIACQSRDINYRVSFGQDDRSHIRFAETFRDEICTYIHLSQFRKCRYFFEAFDFVVLGVNSHQVCFCLEIFVVDHFENLRR